jgi:gamma-glutamyltranspeptidase/glutathione hydrolase
VIAALIALGHEVSVIPAQSPLAGHPGAIALYDDGRCAGAHDPRSDGIAMAV